MKKNMISTTLAVLIVAFLLTAPATAAAANSDCEATLTHNGTVTEYETLKQAFANADNGDTITLEQDVTTDSYLHIEKDITFDLNHFSGDLDTLSMGVNDLTVENGTLVVRYIESSGDGNDNGLLYLNNAAVTVEFLSWMTGDGIKLENSTMTITTPYTSTGSKLEILDEASYIYCIGSLGIRATEAGLEQTAAYLPTGYSLGAPNGYVDTYVLDADGNQAENFCLRIQPTEGDEYTASVTYRVEPTYTVTIPASVSLGGTGEISISNICLARNSRISVSLGEDTDFVVKNSLGTELAYELKLGETVKAAGDVIVSANAGQTTATQKFSLTTPESVTYAGEYTGTLIFSIGVETGTN